MSQNNLLTIIIPAYNPSMDLVKIIKELLDHDSSNKIENIIIVNDGSNNDSKLIFELSSKKPKVIVLSHDINKGKGAALKTALRYLLANQNNSIGFLTMDADGQHLINDIYKVGDKFLSSPDKMVLGVREFDRKIPLRSKFGNVLTKYIFRIISGLKISDTQTGLRVIPKNKAHYLLQIDANGYEFEMDMLLKSKSYQLDIAEMPINTIYLNNNQSSHFNPVLDSLKIYFVLLRFSLSGLLSALIDYVVFAVTFFIYNNIGGSQFVARSISCIFNFYLNRNGVFFSKGSVIITLIKYLSLVVFSGFGSYFLMISYTQFISENVFLAKLLAEVIFFFINFRIQKNIVFKN